MADAAEKHSNLLIGIVTCSSLINGSSDDRLMLDHLSQLYQCKLVAWDDNNVQWEKFTLLIIRSTWDYVGKFQEFKKWLDRIDSIKVKILNDSNVIRWNWNKEYLIELERNGIEIVPSIFVKRSESAKALKDYVSEALKCGKFERDQSEFVMKPTVSADAYGTFRFNLTNCDEMDVEFRKYLSEFDMIIQPFVHTIQTTGEESYLFFNGVFSHACKKHPAPQDFRVQENFGGKILPNSNPSVSNLKVATNIVKFISESKGNLLFARVDMLNYRDRLCLSECELFEPSLYFLDNKENIQRFVDAVSNIINQL